MTKKVDIKRAKIALEQLERNIALSRHDSVKTISLVFTELSSLRDKYDDLLMERDNLLMDKMELEKELSSLRKTDDNATKLIKAHSVHHEELLPLHNKNIKLRKENERLRGKLKAILQILNMVAVYNADEDNHKEVIAKIVREALEGEGDES